MNQYGHYVAIDIESYGLAPSGPIVEVGYCIGSMDPTRTEFKESGSWCIKHEDKEMHRETKTFWDTCPDNKQRIQKQAMSPDQAWAQILMWRNGLTAQYGSKLVWLSDNPAYDLSSMDHELYQRFQRPSIRYETNGSYQCVQDPTEQLEGLPAWVARSLHVQVKRLMQGKSLHQAANDAEQIYFKQKVIDQWKQKESLGHIIWGWVQDRLFGSK